MGSRLRGLSPMTTIRTPDDEVTRPGWFTEPFREGLHYLGATYAGHSDFAVDFNRRTPSGAWVSDEGDPVLASADGTVSEVDKGDGLVLINHYGGLRRTESRHMANILVKVGQKVQRSERIGSIGNVAGDGRSFGAHLHAVHYSRATVRSAWRSVVMRFEGKPVATSVADSDRRPKSWQPPSPVMVEGPPPKATWESAFREASKALTKTEERLDDQKAQADLFTDERNQARRELATAAATIVAQGARIAELEATAHTDCSIVEAERDHWRTSWTALRVRIDAAGDALGFVTGAVTEAKDTR